MFIYEVFEVVGSTAPNYEGVASKIAKVGMVKANNSVAACHKVKRKLDISPFSILYAHQKYELREE
tara:strand:- start:235 stop:432 length:198 start_codon:yes stop_codon:yes gene_type:complete